MYVPPDSLKWKDNHDHTFHHTVENEDADLLIDEVKDNNEGDIDDSEFVAQDEDQHASDIKTPELSVDQNNRPATLISRRIH